MKKVRDIRPGDYLVCEPIKVTKVEFTETDALVTTEDGRTQQFALEGDPAIPVMEQDAAAEGQA